MLQGAKATIKTDGMHTYALTISKHQKKDYVDKSDLDATIVSLKWTLTDLTFVEYTYENSGKYQQLHIHAIVQTKKPVFFKKNNSLNGFRLQWKKLYNQKHIKGWRAYCRKEVDCKARQEQIFEENYYNHNCFFTD